MLKKLITLAIIAICASLLGFTIAQADVTYTNAAGVGSIGEAFSNGVVINSGVAPTTSGLCLVTGTSGVTASYTTCPGGGGSGVPSVNSQTGAITIAAGSNVSVTTGTNLITIAATGGGAVSGAIAVSSVTATSAVIGANTLSASGVQIGSGGSLTVGGGGTGILGATGMSGMEVIDIDASNPLKVEQALRRSDSTPSQAAQSFCGKQRGTLASPLAVVSGDTLCNKYGYGYDGADYFLSSAIVTSVGGTVSTGVIPGYMSFQTTNGSGVMTEAFHVDSNQVTTYKTGIQTPWITTAVSGVATAGVQYAVNTSGVPAASAIQITLPASSTAATVTFLDYQGTFGNSNLIISSASGVPINGTAAPSTLTISTSWIKVICTYLDATIGYRCFQ